MMDLSCRAFIPIFIMNLRKRDKLVKTIKIQNCPTFLLTVHVTKIYHRRDSFDFFIPHPYIYIYIVY